MKKTYFITVKREGDKEMHAEERQGYIYTDRYNNRYGCTKVGAVWFITEVKTGHLANINGREPRTRAEISNYIDSIADFVYEHVTNNENAFPKAKAIIKEAYAKWDRENIGRELN